MANRTRTPRVKRGQRSKSPAQEKPKPNKITKQKKKTAKKDTPLKTRNHGMKTRARGAEIHHQLDRYQKHTRTPSPQPLGTPETPQTPLTHGAQSSERKRSLWRTLSINFSFWNLVKTSAEESAGTRASSYDSTNVDHIISRLHSSISNQFDSYKYEDFGFLSSSPSGYDPRELLPVTDDEVDELRTAIWPTVQHVVEMTKSYIRLPNAKECYLDQIRHIREQLRNVWQDQGHLGNAPSPFQLESWVGGIGNWRSSTYTDGTTSYPAALISDNIETWRNELPSPTPLDATMAENMDHELSSPAIVHAAPGWNRNSASPTPGCGTNRLPMSSLYDSNRDLGFLPTASAIHAHQTGTATLPSYSMSDLPLPPSSASHSPPPLRRRHSRHPIVPIFEDPSSPPAASGDEHQVQEDQENYQPPYQVRLYGSATGDVAMDEGSDKENNMYLAVSVDRRLRAEQNRQPTPSSSQDAIDPVGERMVRSVLTGQEWEIERGAGWGGLC